MSDIYFVSRKYGEFVGCLHTLELLMTEGAEHKGRISNAQQALIMTTRWAMTNEPAIMDKFESRVDAVLTYCEQVHGIVDTLKLNPEDTRKAFVVDWEAYHRAYDRKPRRSISR